MTTARSNHLHDELTFVAQVPAEVALNYCVVPLHFEPGLVSIATANELTDRQAQRLRDLLASEIKLLSRESDWIMDRIKQLYDIQLVGDDDSYCFWPHWHSFENDALTIKMSGYESNGAHWTGCAEFKPKDENYKFYVWLVENPEYHRIVWDEELAEIKLKWKSNT